MGHKPGFEQLNGNVPEPLSAKLRRWARAHGLTIGETMQLLIDQRLDTITDDEVRQFLSAKADQDYGAA